MLESAPRAQQNEDDYNFQSLPDEVKLKILQFLNPRDLLKFGSTDRANAELAKDNALWQAHIDKYAPAAKQWNEENYKKDSYTLFKLFFSKEAILKKLVLKPFNDSVKAVGSNLLRNCKLGLGVIKNMASTLFQLFLAKIKYSIYMAAISLMYTLLSNSFSYIGLALGAAIVGKLAFDVGGIFFEQMKRPYKVYASKSHLAFALNIDDSTDPKIRNDKYLAAKAGVEAQQNWSGWSKSFLNLPAWKQYRAFLAGKEAHRTNDAGLEQQIVSYTAIRNLP